MSAIVETILSAYEAGKWLQALEACDEYISSCKSAFMEELTVETATSFAGSTILYAQICAGEKKPWKAVPKLEDIRGCLRFMEDFMQDRGVLASTCYSVASAFEGAGFYPEAGVFYQKALEQGSDPAILENAAYSAIFFSMREGAGADSDLRRLAEEKLGKETLTHLLEEAREALDQMPRWDPVELDEAYLKVRFDVEARVDQILSVAADESEPFCIRYWACKKKILQEEFGISWKTPAECNPGIRFA